MLIKTNFFLLEYYWNVFVFSFLSLKNILIDTYKINAGTCCYRTTLDFRFNKTLSFLTAGYAEAKWLAIVQHGKKKCYYDLMWVQKKKEYILLRDFIDFGLYSKNLKSSRFQLTTTLTMQGQLVNTAEM